MVRLSSTTAAHRAGRATPGGSGSFLGECLATRWGARIGACTSPRIGGRVMNGSINCAASLRLLQWVEPSLGLRSSTRASSWPDRAAALARCGTASRSTQRSLRCTALQWSPSRARRFTRRVRPGRLRLQARRRRCTYSRLGLSLSLCKSLSNLGSGDSSARRLLQRVVCRSHFLAQPGFDRLVTPPSGPEVRPG